MISFLRVLDPVRLVAVLLIFLAIKIPMLVKGIPLLNAELSWLLIGEKMATGSILYKDIWTTLEPFSAGFYFLLCSIFGKSQLALQITNILIVFAQAVFFNIILNKNNVYNDRSSLPALIYVVFSFLFFDLNTLSPLLLGTTFILGAFSILLLQLRIKSSQEMTLLIGIMVGTATLFYLSLVYFLIAVIIILMIHLFPPVKVYFTLIAGFFIPFLIVICYYFFINGLDELYHHLMVPFFKISIPRYISLLTALLLAIPLLILSVFSVLILQKSKYINYQYQVIKITIIWGIVGGISLLFVKNLQPFHLFIIIPPSALLTSHFFLIYKNYWVKETVLFTLLGVIVAFNYFSLYDAKTKELINYAGMLVNQKDSLGMYKDKKVLVIGENKAPYLDNHMATPYFSWTLSEKELTSLDDYHHLSQINTRFSSDMPDIIVDEKEIVPKLFFRLPHLEKEYERIDKSKIYKKKNFNEASYLPH